MSKDKNNHTKEENLINDFEQKLMTRFKDYLEKDLVPEKHTSPDDLINRKIVEQRMENLKEYLKDVNLTPRTMNEGCSADRLAAITGMNPSYVVPVINHAISDIQNAR
jgi:hypothetical protein